MLRAEKLLNPVVCESFLTYVGSYAPTRNNTQRSNTMNTYEPNDRRPTSGDIAAGWTLWFCSVVGLAVWCGIGTMLTV